MVQSLLDFQNLNQNHVLKIMNQSLKLKADFKKQNLEKSVPQKSILGTAGLLFFEPSTRTRFSFQTACIRSGIVPMILDSPGGSSLEKGESIADTIYNLEAMGPLFFVVRCSDEINLREISLNIGVPILNAGWGIQGHPTQALLDITTLFERWKTLENKNILFVGDVAHSRVFSSHLQLSKIMNYNLGFCAPECFKTDLDPESNLIQNFQNMDQALNWADAVITLRVQKERHAITENKIGDQTIAGLSLDEYRRLYGLNSTRAKNLKPEGLILHPGPINYGVEIEKNITEDSRSVILQLVENGVFIRQVIIQNLISGDLK